MKLSEVREAKRLKIITIQGGFQAVNKLRVLGVVQGSFVTLENNSYHGPITILNQDGMKIAIGRRLAERVEVECIE